MPPIAGDATAPPAPIDVVDEALVTRTISDEDDVVAPEVPKQAMPRGSKVGLKQNSILATVSQHPNFQNTTLMVIVFNALWIGVEVQTNHPNLENKSTDTMPQVTLIVENSFCVYFSGEVLIRFFAYDRKLDFFKDSWNNFDGLLVGFMVLETWVLTLIGALVGGGSDGLLSKFSALRLLRLLRLTRMARIMQAVPELLTLVKGMISATRAVSFILIILVICMYVFAIIFTAQFGDSDAPERKYPLPYWENENEPQPTAVELFGSMGDSMISLFTRGMLCDNLAETLIAIRDHGDEIVCELEENSTEYNAEVCERGGGSLRSLALMWVFIMFVMISSCCLLNMLIGVLCEVIQASAARESEAAQMKELYANMQQAFESIDASNDGLITAAEWKLMKNESTVRSSMANLGVEEQHMDERLDQMQESLFGSIEDDSDDDDPDAQHCNHAMRTSLRKQNRGLSFDQFLDKVVEIRPDAPACAIDIEVLRTRVEREERTINIRLNLIEEALTNVTANPSPEKLCIAADAEPKPIEMPDWLGDVPTEVLFAVLQSRAPPELGPPKVLSQSQTAPPPPNVIKSD